MAEPKGPDGKKIPRATKMPIGKGWRLITPKIKGRLRATLLKTFSVQDKRLAVFQILDMRKK
jgi:hypothetical protein